MLSALAGCCCHFIDISVFAVNQLTSSTLVAIQCGCGAALGSMIRQAVIVVLRSMAELADAACNLQHHKVTTTCGTSTTNNNYYCYIVCM